jgi:mono/diheme cytochrome c family protein
VITHGYGVMYPYADRVAPQDRWAIVAYIRALQLSQHAPLAQLPAGLRARLAAAPATAASGARR